MTRTAISPRLAMRIFLNIFLSNNARRTEDFTGDSTFVAECGGRSKILNGRERQGGGARGEVQALDIWLEIFLQ
jgi:hypothetical protein